MVFNYFLLDLLIGYWSKNSRYFFIIVMICSVFAEVIDFAESLQRRTYYNWVCKIVDAKTRDHEWADLCCLIRCAACKVPIVMSSSMLLITSISLFLKILYSLFIILFFRICLRWFFLYTVNPLELLIDKSLEDASLIKYIGSCRYSVNCVSINNPRWSDGGM